MADLPVMAAAAGSLGAQQTRRAAHRQLPLGCVRPPGMSGDSVSCVIQLPVAAGRRAYRRSHGAGHRAPRPPGEPLPSSLAGSCPVTITTSPRSLLELSDERDTALQLRLALQGGARAQCAGAMGGRVRRGDRRREAGAARACARRPARGGQVGAGRRGMARPGGPQRWDRVRRAPGSRGWRWTRRRSTGFGGSREGWRGERHWAVVRPRGPPGGQGHPPQPGRYRRRGSRAHPGRST